MKQGSNQRRSRGRGNNSGGGNRRGSRNQTYDSNGPDVKVRGSAQQVLDKYLQLARDAQSGGDRVKAEALLQFAEHYYRIVNADQEEQKEKRAAENPEQGEGQADRPNNERTAERQPRGRSRGRNTSGNNKGGNGSGNTKNEATLAAEAAAANEAKAKAKEAEKAESSEVEVVEPETEVATA